MYYKFFLIFPLVPFTLTSQFNFKLSGSAGVEGVKVILCLNTFKRNENGKVNKLIKIIIIIILN